MRRHELVVFATRGSRPIGRTNVDDVLFGAPPQRVHSAKPDEFYEMVERCSPGPRLEMFTRSRRSGWSVWGAEVPRAVQDAAEFVAERERAS